MPTAMDEFKCMMLRGRKFSYIFQKRQIYSHRKWTSGHEELEPGG